MSGGIGQTYQAAGKLSLCSNPAVILRVALTHERLAGCSKRLFSKAAASEEARRTLRYVEPLSEARTMLADFFSILSMIVARIPVMPPTFFHEGQLIQQRRRYRV